MFLPFVSSEIETIRAIPFCLKEYSSADNKASAWYFSSFLHTSKWLFSVKFTLSEWGWFDVDEIRLSRPKTGDYAAEPRSTVAICRWSLSIVSFAQLPAIKEDFLFFVEGKTTISCFFFIFVFLLNLKTISIIFSVILIMYSIRVLWQQICHRFKRTVKISNADWFFKALMNCDNYVIQS